MTTKIEETESARTNPKQTASRGAPRAHVASKKHKTAKKPASAKKAPRSEKKVNNPRKASKTSAVLELLQRPDGVTLAELMSATEWQAHSVRGFLSGTIGKKNGLDARLR